MTAALRMPENGTAADDLAAVLDTVALRRAIARAGLADPDRVEIARIFFSDRRPTVLRLHVSHGGRTEPLFAEAIGAAAADHAEAETARLSKTRRAQIRKGDRRSVVADGESGLVFRAPGLDARLPGLRLLADRAAAKSLIDRIAPTSAASGEVDVRLMAHRLGKRAVLRIDCAGGLRVFVRLGPTAGDGGALAYARHFRIAEELEGHPDVVVPRPLGFDAELGAAVYSALPGRPPRLSGVDGVHDAHATLKALSALREVDPDGLRPYGPREELALLGSWADRVALLRPIYRTVIGEALDHITVSFCNECCENTVFCHRDFHEGQILIDDGCAGIMDFDTAALADPMIDTGNLMAHYCLHGVRAGVDVAPMERAVSAPLPRSGGGETARLHAWRRSALLRLACIYALTSEPDRVVAALFARAAA